MPASGASQVDADVVRQRLQRRDVDDVRLVGQRAAVLEPSRTSSSIAARNAASVLPEPVGAAISVGGARGSPARRAPARRSAPGNVRRNQSATAGWKPASALGEWRIVGHDLF